MTIDILCSLKTMSDFSDILKDYIKKIQSQKAEDVDEVFQIYYEKMDFILTQMQDALERA